MNNNKIEKGDYIRCTYGDDSELYGTVLQVSPEQQIITIKSSGVLTIVNVNSRNLDMIEVMEEEK